MKSRIKNCILCQKEFFGTSETKDAWLKRKFCSLSCYYKVPRSQEVKEKISRGNLKSGVGKWMLGRVRPTKLRIRQSTKMKERVLQGIHNFWKGGISEQTRSFKANFQNTVEYRLWRTAVFTRDNYTCIWCGARNGNGKKIELNADHIKPFAQYPELRLAIDNGRTLCRECHYKRHSK